MFPTASIGSCIRRTSRTAKGGKSTIKCYIKSIKDFSLLSVFDALTYTLKDGGDSTVTVLEDGIETYVGEWLLINNEVYYIYGASPEKEKLKLNLKHPIYAFSRLLPFSGELKLGELIASGITNGFINGGGDATYSMPYVTVENSDTTAYTANVNEFGYYSLLDTMLEARRDKGVEVSFSVEGNKSQTLHIRVYKTNYETTVFTFNDGHHQLVSETYDNGATSKSTVVQKQADGSFVTTDYYLDKNHHISTTPPAERLAGVWKIYGAEADESALAVATGSFSANRDAHKIEFYADKFYTVYSPVKIRLHDAAFDGVISSRELSNKDGRYLYKVGDLKNTVTEKLQVLEQNVQSGVSKIYVDDRIRALTASDVKAVSTATPFNVDNLKALNANTFFSTTSESSDKPPITSYWALGFNNILSAPNGQTISGYHFQLASDLGYNKLFSRSQYDNTWTDWAEIAKNGDGVTFASVQSNGALSGTSAPSALPSSLFIVPNLHYMALGMSTGDPFTFFRKWLISICAIYSVPEGLFIGTATPDVQGFVRAHVYNTADKNAEGLPRYASGTFQSLTGLWMFRTLDFAFTCQLVSAF